MHGDERSGHQISAETEQGRGIILEIIDGARPLGVESDEDIHWRRELPRKIGHKA